MARLLVTRPVGEKEKRTFFFHSVFSFAAAQEEREP
jgi:hypothetical protein